MWIWHDTYKYDGQNWFWQFLISAFFCRFFPNTLKSQQQRILHGLRPDKHWARQQRAILDLLFQSEPHRNPPSCDASLKPLLAQALLVSAWGWTSAPTVSSEHRVPAMPVQSHGRLGALPKHQDSLAGPSRHNLPTAKSKEELSPHFPCSYTFALVLLPDCQSGMASSAAVL